MQVSKEQAKRNAETFASMFHVCHLTGNQVAPLTDGITVDPGVAQKGGQYWVYECPKCGNDAPLFEDRTNGQFPNPFSGPHFVHVPCPRCEVWVSAPAWLARSIRWHGYY